MKQQLPLCCSPAAYHTMVRQASMIESADALLEGAVAIAMHQMDDATVGGTDRAIQEFADTVRSRVHGEQPQAMLAHLHQFLFDEEGFIGNRDNFSDPLNSYLPAILKTKQGLPITLSLLYKLVGERLGLRIQGIGLPGHFITAVESHGVETRDDGRSIMLVDAFNRGRILTIDEARTLASKGANENAEFSDDLFQPVTNLHWLTRMLQNLLQAFGNSGQFANVAAMLELEMALWPEEVHLQRDLGLVFARIGLAGPATEWLDNYLKANPGDPQRGDLEQLLDVLSA